MSAGEDNDAGTHDSAIMCDQSFGDTDTSKWCIPTPNHQQLTGHGEITEIIEEEEGGQGTNYKDDHDHNHPGHDYRVIYVAVGSGETSMDALSWALTHALIPPPTLVYLLHIFSYPKFFPSPLGGGRVPKSQVSPELADTYMAQDRSKRRELLNKYIHKCTAHLVQVETILIENDSVTDGITQLISVLHIPKLVVGISKSNLRKLGEGKGKGKGSEIVAEKILKRALPGCEVDVICKGKNVSELIAHELPCPMTYISSKLRSPVASLHSTSTTCAIKEGSEDNTSMQQHSPSASISFSCCFKPNPSINFS